MADAMTSDSASRVSRSRRSLGRTLLLGGAVLAVAAGLRAQESAPARPAASPPAATSAGTAAAPTDIAADRPASSPAADSSPVPAVPEAGAPAAEPSPVTASPESAPAAGDTDADVAPAARAGKPDGAVGPTRDRFEPSEKVRADFDVSFPVDI
jgi:hypothetical protein